MDLNLLHRALDRQGLPGWKPMDQVKLDNLGTPLCPPGDKHLKCKRRRKDGRSVGEGEKEDRLTLKAGIPPWTVFLSDTWLL